MRFSWSRIRAFIKAPATLLYSALIALGALVSILGWCQARVRVNLDVRHYSHGPVSEPAVAHLREWMRSDLGRAYDHVDIVWYNRGDVPETNFSILAAVSRNGEILTCEFVESRLRPTIQIRRAQTQCEVTVDRVAAGATDSIRIRYRSPLVNWLYLCEFAGTRGGMCDAPRPSADSVYRVSVSAEGNGPPIKVRTRHFTLQLP